MWCTHGALFRWRHRAHIEHEDMPHALHIVHRSRDYCIAYDKHMCMRSDKEREVQWGQTNLLSFRLKTHWTVYCIHVESNWCNYLSNLIGFTVNRVRYLSMYACMHVRYPDRDSCPRAPPSWEVERKNIPNNVCQHLSHMYLYMHPFNIWPSFKKGH